MTVTFGETIYISSGVIRLTWSSDLEDPTYYIYLDGAFELETKIASIDVRIPSGETMAVEVFDNSTDRPQFKWPPRFTLCWHGAGNWYFRVEQYVAGAWALRAKVADTAQGYYVWTSGILADCQTHQFRVIPVTLAGREGEALTFETLMVRLPDAPDLDYSYDENTGTITIT